MTEITVLFFGITTDLVGENSIKYAIENSSTVSDLKLKLISDYSSLKNLNEFAIAVNEEYATNETMLNNNDVVAIIPPVSGG